MAKLEKNIPTNDIKTKPEEEQQNSSQEFSSKESTPSTTPQEENNFYGIIKRRWSKNIENKLVEHIGNSNLHPLAQKLFKRVDSHAKGLKELAEVFFYLIKKNFFYELLVRD
jgi:hypothetical protein